MSVRAWSLAGAVGLCAFASSALAHADPVVGEVSVEVAVGRTISIDVGFARGLRCDDLSIIQAELRGVSPTSNRLFITGVRSGTTACRAGTTGAPTVLVHITVK